MSPARRCMAICGMIAVIWLIPTPASATTTPESLDECDRMVRDAPDAGDSYYCYTRFVSAHGQAADAVRRLQAILAIDPDRHRARLNLAIIEHRRGSPRTEALYREAVDGLEADDDFAGVVYGGTSLAYLLGKRNRAEEAWAELDRAMAAARASDDPMLVAWVWNSQGFQAMGESDYGRALRLYRRAEAMAFPEGRLDLQCRILSGIGSVLWYFRDYEGAMEVYRREAEIWERLGDRYNQASPLYNLAILATDFADQLDVEKEEIRKLALEALRAAVGGGNLRVEARTRMLLGQNEKGADAVAEFRRALALAKREGDLSLQLQAKRLIAQFTVDIGPDHVDEGLHLMEETVAEARETASLFDEARGLIGLAFLVAVHRSHEEAVPLLLEALDVVERIRLLQPDETVRARVFTRWTYPYYRLSGHLLRGLERSSDPDADLDLAFRTMERLRARTLLDALSAAGAVSPPVDDALASARADLLGKISETQRELMSPDLAGSARKALLTELDSLELRESDLRDRIARDDPRFAETHATDIPSLETIRNTLTSDQALLSFQLWGSHDVATREIDIGASWLIVVTTDHVRTYPIPERVLLRDQVELFDGLLANRDGSEAPAAAILYEGLLKEAVEDLPDRIHKLVIIPDGALHKLPFDTLRSDPEAPPLASRFDVSIVPSATVWMGLKAKAEKDRQPSRALALADPDLSESTGIDRLRTANPWIEGLRIGRLPYAVDEARAMVRAVRGGSRLLTDAEASEHNVRKLDLDRYGILHFAAHAVVDDEKPERSAILLATGEGSDDGLLQVREIVELDLGGKMVILTGCRSASGTVMEGEGVIGLARAFFRAGATTVIGGLWPLRDDDTALLMEEFSRQIGKGRSVGEAMSAAKRSRIAAGSPAASWAGLIVLGDADIVPVPGGNRGWLRPTALGAAVFVVALLAWLVLRMRGR